MSFKYIMLNDGLHDIPIIFPDRLVHESVASSLLQHEEHKNLKVVSAGSVDIGLDCSCYGKSETLKLESRPEDGRVISMYPYMHGIMNIEMSAVIVAAFEKISRQKLDSSENCE